MQGNPGLSREVGGRLDEEWDVCCAGDIKAEAVLTHAEAALGRLQGGVPQRRGEAVKGRPPSGGSGQIITVIASTMVKLLREDGGLPLK